MNLGYSYQISCRNCGKISQSLLPIVKQDGLLELTCMGCDHILFYIYGEEHIFTKTMEKLEE